MSNVTIRPISAEQTRPLRRRILRPGQRPEELVYLGDDDPRSLHVGAFAGDTLIGVASVYPQGEEVESLLPPSLRDRSAGRAGTHPDGQPWRLRGMAVEASMRGAGYGAALLQACLDHVRAEQGAYLWCAARSTVLGFYERFGMQRLGEPFDITGLGPHCYMYVRSRPISSAHG